MPTVTLYAGTESEVVIAYDELGERDAEPVLLIAGCGQPAFAWQVGVGPAVAAADIASSRSTTVGLRRRHRRPRRTPSARWSTTRSDCSIIWRSRSRRIAGHSMGGWIAETITARHPERVRAAAFLGSCNVPTSWEKAITTVERDLDRPRLRAPPLSYTTETLRYLPNSDLQDDATVDTWLMFIGDNEPWPNPGRFGRYEACLAWSTDPEHGARWPAIAVPCLVMAFEHDVDSPPMRAREAAAIIPNASYVEIPGTSHLAPFTHADAVAGTLVEFFHAT